MELVTFINQLSKSKKEVKKFNFLTIRDFSVFSVVALVLQLQGCAKPVDNNVSEVNEDIIEIKVNNSDNGVFRIGDKIEFNVSVNKPLYVHCFYVSGKDIYKFSPEHYPGYHGVIRPVRPGATLDIGAVYAAAPVGRDSFSCIGSKKPLLYDLPREISELEVFKKTGYSSMESLIEVFRNTAESELVFKTLNITIIK